MAEALIVLIWLSMTAYGVLGGADFGGGALDLFARGPRAERQRAVIGASMGPVWEANHVWLIYFITGLFAAFPRAYEALSVALYLPMLLALVGIVLRGAAFAFRGHYQGAGAPRALLGRVFGVASTITPFFLGTAAGALAGESIRVRGHHVEFAGVVSIWTHPFPLVCGALAVAVCAYLAAIYLTVDAVRFGEPELIEDFRLRGLLAGTLAGALSVLGLALAAADAKGLYHGLTGEALPLVILGVAAGVAAMGALWWRRYLLARTSAALAVAAVIWGWGVARYPHLVGPDVTVSNAAAPGSTLTALLIGAGIGMALLIPALYLLLVMFRRDPPPLPE